MNIELDGEVSASESELAHQLEALRLISNGDLTTKRDVDIACSAPGEMVGFGTFEHGDGPENPGMFLQIPSQRPGAEGVTLQIGFGLADRSVGFTYMNQFEDDHRVTLRRLAEDEQLPAGLRGLMSVIADTPQENRYGYHYVPEADCGAALQSWGQLHQELDEMGVPREHIYTHRDFLFDQEVEIRASYDVAPDGRATLEGPHHWAGVRLAGGFDFEHSTGDDGASSSRYLNLAAEEDIAAAAVCLLAAADAHPVTIELPPNGDLDGAEYVVEATDDVQVRTASETTASSVSAYLAELRRIETASHAASPEEVRRAAAVIGMVVRGRLIENT